MRFNLARHNTLRNQILLVFLSVMVLVLCLVGIMTYNLVSSLLQTNAEKQIQQTAIEATGRMESLYEQIDMLTKQIAADSYVQSILLKEKQGTLATFTERQKIMQRGSELQAVYSYGITSFEVYSLNKRRLIPLREGGLYDRIGHKWIDAANKAKGKMVWAGKDPKELGHYLVIKQVRLITQSYEHGGYLIVNIDPNYFDMTETNDNQEFVVLVDQDNHAISSNYEGNIQELVKEKDDTIEIDGSDYMIVKQTSKVTGWTMYYLTPLSNVTEGMTVLRSAIILSGAFGFLIYVVSSILLSTMITRPILKLTKTMKRGRDKGKLTINPDISSTIEIQELNTTYNQLVENTNHLIQVVYEKEILKSQAELKALQSQINPHFLFNTLDALYWSLDEKGEDELANSVIAMSELFRYTISSQKQDEWVTLKQEIEHIEMYMQLMKMRFGDRFTWSVSIPEIFETINIPKLLIQPIVENAILHGVGNKVGEGFVHIIVTPSSKQGYLLISIQDNGPGMKKEAINDIYNLLETGKVYSMRGNGMAIANVNKRLILYYNQEAEKLITITSEEKKGTCFTFEIPIRHDVLKG
ncbi:cache domain-containing sensor histidine kinase [Metabacillus malikii]|uniref:Two-component system sensor histidine kinase YesM n=1 Tax=Metabacillus malikii TaxID=1504265 RepID=A0ABT9ZAS5_9BACI|nr:sensor histidine kinase [Metabacillus malikii]MDQ0229351.1 two-component system sensor histidine kinase YesM [Metabacillus malikii]